MLHPLPQASPCDPPVMEEQPQPLHAPITAVVYIDREKVKFPTTAVGSEEVKKVRVVNKDCTAHSVSHCRLSAERFRPRLGQLQVLVVQT